MVRKSPLAFASRAARWRVPLTALTISKYFRDERHQNVLLLINNVFRFTLAA